MNVLCRGLLGEFGLLYSAQTVTGANTSRLQAPLAYPPHCRTPRSCRYLAFLVRPASPEALGAVALEIELESEETR